MSHTKLPWTLTADGRNGKNVEDDEMAFFCCNTGNAKGNAEIIIKSILMHDELIEALESVEQEAANASMSDSASIILGLATEALKRAKGE